MSRREGGFEKGTAGMADDTSTTEATESESAESEDVSGLKSALEKEREARKAAEKDAKRAKELEARVAQFEQAQMSEAEKAAARLAAVEKEAADARAEATRFRIAAEFQLSENDAKALEHVGSEDGMRFVAERLASREAERKKNGNLVPHEGNNPTSTGDQSDEGFAHALFSPRE